MFREIEKDLPDTLAKLDQPHHYLSPARLEQFSAKEHFTPEEFRALIKTLIWSHKTKTGLLSELKFHGNEKAALPMFSINDDPEKEPFYKKALEKDEKSPALVTHQWLIENQPELKDLILIDFNAFSETLFFQNAHKLSLQYCLNHLQNLPTNDTTEALGQKLTILFGVIGLIYEKYNDHSNFFPRAYLDDNLLSTKEAQDLRPSIANLYELSQDLAPLNTPEHSHTLQQWKKCLEALKATFVDTNLADYLSYIELDYKEEPVFHSVPYSVSTQLNSILQNCQTYRLLDENLDLDDDSSFTKDLHGLPPHLATHLHPPASNCPLYIAADGPDDDHRKELIHYLANNLHGQTAVVFNSQKALQFHTLELAAALREADSSLTVVSQLTGSKGKLAEQFKKDPANSVLLVNRYFWQTLPQEIHDQIHHLYIHRIPFDPPSHPFILTQSPRYKNAFFDFQIPRATFALRSILNRLTANAQSATILDSRLDSKRYGQDISQKFDQATTIKIFN